MSLAKQIQEATARINTLEKELASAQEDLKKANKAAEDAVKERDALKASLDKLNTEIEAERKRVQESHDQAVAEIDKLKAELEAAEKTHKEVSDKLVKAEKALANPAFAAAAIEGVKAGSTEDAPDGAAAAEPTPEQPKVSIWEQYSAITDPVEKAMFWTKHEEELKKYMADHYDEFANAAK